MLAPFTVEGSNLNINVPKSSTRRYSIIAKDFDNEYDSQQQAQVISSEFSRPVPNHDGTADEVRVTQTISIPKKSIKDTVKPKGRYLLLFILEPIINGGIIVPVVVLFWNPGWNLCVCVRNALSGYALNYNLDGPDYSQQGYGLYSLRTLFLTYLVAEVSILILYLGQDIFYKFLERRHIILRTILLKLHILILGSMYIVQWEAMWTIWDQYLPQDWPFLMVISLAACFALMAITGTLSDIVYSPFVACYDSIEYCIRIECSLDIEHVSSFLVTNTDIQFIFEDFSMESESD